MAPFEPPARLFLHVWFLAHPIFPAKRLEIPLPAMEMPTLAAAEPSVPRQSPAFPLSAPGSRGGQRGPGLVRLHGEEERVRTARPTAASGPAVPKHSAAPKSCRRHCCVSARASRRVSRGVCATSRSCGHKDVFTSSPGVFSHPNHDKTLSVF